MKTFALFATFLALPMLAGADACDTYCNTYCKNRGYDSGTCIRSQAVSKDTYNCSCTITGGVPRQPDDLPLVTITSDSDFVHIHNNSEKTVVAVHMVNENGAGSTGMGPVAPHSSEPYLSARTDRTWTVDGALFADGSIFGPNEWKLDEYAKTAEAASRGQIRRGCETNKTIRESGNSCGAREKLLRAHANAVKLYPIAFGRPAPKCVTQGHREGDPKPEYCQGDDPGTTEPDPFDPCGYYTDQYGAQQWACDGGEGGTPGGGGGSPPPPSMVGWNTTYSLSPGFSKPTGTVCQSTLTYPTIYTQTCQGTAACWPYPNTWANWPIVAVGAGGGGTCQTGATQVESFEEEYMVAGKEIGMGYADFTNTYIDALSGAPLVENTWMEDACTWTEFDTGGPIGMALCK